MEANPFRLGYIGSRWVNGSWSSTDSLLRYRAYLPAESYRLMEAFV
jgi:hypothetical protein